VSPGADQAQTRERPTRGQVPNFSFDASSQGRGAHLVNETLGSQFGEPGMLVDGFAADGGGDVGVPGYAAGQGVGTKTGGSDSGTGSGANEKVQFRGHECECVIRTWQPSCRDLASDATDCRAACDVSDIAKRPRIRERSTECKIAFCSRTLRSVEG